MAVVRVKRRIDEEPLNAFILNCKKRRHEDESVGTHRGNLLETKDEVSTILKFAGTVESQDGNIGSQITKLSKGEAKELASKIRKPNLTGKNRKEMRQTIHDNRFKVVDCFRAIQSVENDATPKEITVVDIEKEAGNESEINPPFSTGNEQQENVPNSSSSVSQSVGTQQNYFVYDLYLPATSDEQHIMNVDHNDTTYLSVHPFDDLVYEDQYNDSESMCESEDSNAEDNFKNDYPDTEEESSINESDMIQAAENFDIEGEQSLSSDDDYYEEEYVHSINTTDDFSSDFDYIDDRIGTAYARYKARLLRKERGNYLYGNDDYLDECSSDE